jgi:hypothetical protein
LEVKEAELSKLKEENGKLQRELSGTNTVKQILKEKEDEIKKLNTELHEARKGSPIDLHKGCSELISAIKLQLTDVRAQRDDLAATLGKNIGDVMDEHMK